jgi:hypothetical protein
MRKVPEAEADIDIDGVWYRLETRADLRFARALVKYQGIKLRSPVYVIEKRIKNERLEGKQDGAKRGR